MHLHHQFIEMDSPKWHTMLFGGKMYSHFLLFLRIYLYTLLPISWFVLNWKVSSKRFKVCNILFLFPRSRKKIPFWNFLLSTNSEIGRSVSESLKAEMVKKHIVSVLRVHFASWLPAASVPIHSTRWRGTVGKILFEKFFLNKN